MFQSTIRALAVAAALHGTAAACPFVIAADFPVSFLSNHAPAVTMKINGTDVHMMLDSGAATSFLTIAAYNRLNLTGLQRITGDYATGVAGNMQMNNAVMEDVLFGNIRFKDQIFGVGDGILPAHNNVSADGVVGDDIMHRFDIGLDLPHARVTFYDPQACNAGKVPWTGDYEPMPMTHDRTDLIDTVDYVIDNTTLAAIIDTGAFRTVVSGPALAAAGATPLATWKKSETIGGIGNHVLSANIQQFASITIGAETFDNSWVVVADMPDYRPYTATIGEDYLATHRVFIANSTGTVYLGLTIPTLQ